MYVRVEKYPLTNKKQERWSGGKKPFSQASGLQDEHPRRDFWSGNKEETWNADSPGWGEAEEKSMYISPGTPKDFLFYPYHPTYVQRLEVEPVSPPERGEQNLHGWHDIHKTFVLIYVSLLNIYVRIATGTSLRGWPKATARKENWIRLSFFFFFWIRWSKTICPCTQSAIWGAHDSAIKT
jgi:hypothetical protein